MLRGVDVSGQAMLCVLVVRLWRMLDMLLMMMLLMNGAQRMLRLVLSWVVLGLMLGLLLLGLLMLLLSELLDWRSGSGGMNRWCRLCGLGLWDG